MSQDASPTKEIDIADVVEGQERTWFPIMVFLLCCLIMFADGFDNQALNVSAPLIIRELGISKEILAVAINASTLGWMTGAVLFSMLADRIGRRNAVLMAVTMFGTFTLAITLARDLTTLSVLRFGATCGVGGAMPMAIALVADYTQAKRRGFRIAMMYLGYTLGSFGVGQLAAVISVTYGWQSVFVVGGCIALGIAVILLFALPESARFLLLRGGSQDRIRHYAQRLRPSTPYDENTHFVIREEKGKGAPVKHLFTEKRTAITAFLWLAFTFSFFTHYFMSGYLTTLMAGRMSIPDAQRAGSLFQLGAAFSWIVGWLIDKRGIPVVTAVMVLGALPVALIGIVHASPEITWGIALAAGILVLGGNIGLNAVSSMVYPTFVRSTGTGWAFGVGRIGALLGPTVGALLIGMHLPLAVIFTACGAPLLLAGVSTFFLSRAAETPASSRLQAAEARA